MTERGRPDLQHDREFKTALHAAFELRELGTGPLSDMIVWYLPDDHHPAHTFITDELELHAQIRLNPAGETEVDWTANLRATDHGLIDQALEVFFAKQGLWPLNGDDTVQ